MKRKVLLQIYSEQRYEGDESQVSELTTVGTLEELEGAIRLSYEETELTGLQGTTTAFTLYPDKIVLQREGSLRSEMIFDIQKENRSLYDMGMGALMLTVRTMSLVQAMSAQGGFLAVDYDLIVEDSYMGQVSYRIQVTPTE